MKFNHIFIISFNTDVRNVTIKTLHIIFHIYQNAKNDALNRLNVISSNYIPLALVLQLFSSVLLCLPQYSDVLSGQAPGQELLSGPKKNKVK